MGLTNIIQYARESLAERLEGTRFEFLNTNVTDVAKRAYDVADDMYASIKVNKPLALGLGSLLVAGIASANPGGRASGGPPAPIKLKLQEAPGGSSGICEEVAKCNLREPIYVACGTPAMTRAINDDSEMSAAGLTYEDFSCKTGSEMQLVDGQLERANKVKVSWVGFKKADGYAIKAGKKASCPGYELCVAPILTDIEPAKDWTMSSYAQDDRVTQPHGETRAMQEAPGVLGNDLKRVPRDEEAETSLEVLAESLTLSPGVSGTINPDGSYDLQLDTPLRPGEERVVATYRNGRARPDGSTDESGNVGKLILVGGLAPAPVVPVTPVEPAAPEADDLGYRVAGLSRLRLTESFEDESAGDITVGAYGQHDIFATWLSLGAGFEARHVFTGDLTRVGTPSVYGPSDPDPNDGLNLEYTETRKPIGVAGSWDLFPHVRAELYDSEGPFVSQLVGRVGVVARVDDYTDTQIRTVTEGVDGQDFTSTINGDEETAYGLGWDATGRLGVQTKGELVQLLLDTNVGDQGRGTEYGVGIVLGVGNGHCRLYAGPSINGHGLPAFNEPGIGLTAYLDCGYKGGETNPEVKE